MYYIYIYLYVYVYAYVCIYIYAIYMYMKIYIHIWGAAGGCCGRPTAQVRRDSEGRLSVAKRPEPGSGGLRPAS